jgi:L-fuculose-phosphate aldolase
MTRSTGGPLTDDPTARQAVVTHGRRINELGINQGRSGNLSVRTPDGEGFLITPSGLAYEAMNPDDVVFMRWDGTHQGRDGRAPSSEWRLHRDIYRAHDDALAIVHAHPMFATTLACLERGIPAFHYMVAVAGGCDIRCAPYATFGSQELSDHALAALRERRACLHGHHGMTVFGTSLEEAVGLAVDVETLAAMYWRCLQIGEPVTLSMDEMAVVLEKFKTYGKIVT